MSQDIIRQSNRGDDLWAAAGATFPQQGLAYPAAGMQPGLPMIPPPPAENRPIETIHRSLRGRYKLAILLAAVGAAAGAAAGWKLNERQYRATGFIRIAPVVQTPNANEVTSEYTRGMNSEASSIRSQDIAERAMGKSAWTEVAGARPVNTGTKAAFLSRLRATYNGQSYDIQVTYEDPNPRVAVAAVDSILEAYKDVRAAAQGIRGDTQVAFFEADRKKIQDEIDRLKKQESELQRTAQGNIVDRSSQLGKRKLDMETARADAAMTLAQMTAIADRAKANPQPVSERLLAARDPGFARLVAIRDELKAELLQIQQAQGRNSPNVTRIAGRIELIDKNIAQIAEAMSKELYGVLANGVEVNDVTIENQKQYIALLDSELASLQSQVTEVDDKRVTITELADRIATRQRDLSETEAKLRLAEARRVTLNAPFATQLDPSPSVSEDKRSTMASFGFVVGGAIPVLGLALLGLLDRKYRFSDETNASATTRGIPLLGILPNLPDRLSDPSQASVAAHCVHQIRTMLQLNAVNAEGPTVLSVTSATSGDGKTSLSLALGLSFAASGSRTLLIDTDLIGAGLSNRLGIREPAGISEAITARNAMEFVRDTDVADLSILPVGTAGPQNASAFSPAAVRKLLNEMRKHFDLILIDTGPVLGSIEATPVVASSDAVILTASRGQNRDLVEKAITQLRNAGARIAGFVFNRANAKDFERSISGISLRSVSRAQANPGAANAGTQSASGQYQDNRLGPLVHSVRGTREGE